MVSQNRYTHILYTNVHVCNIVRFSFSIWIVAFHCIVLHRICNPASWVATVAQLLEHSGCRFNSCPSSSVLSITIYHVCICLCACLESVHIEIVWVNACCIPWLDSILSSGSRHCRHNVPPCSRHHTEIWKHQLDTVNFNIHLEHTYMYIHSVYTVHAHFYLCLVHASAITFIIMCTYICASAK